MSIRLPHNDEWVSPAINEASNFKSRFRDYRDGNETEEEKKRRYWREKHGSTAAGGRFRSDPFPESRLPNVNFGRRCWIPDIYGYVPSWLTSIATVREFPGFSIWAFFPRSSDSQLDERGSIRWKAFFLFFFIVLLNAFGLLGILPNC